MTNTLYKFEASWCQPCKVLARTLAAVLPKHPDITVEHVDIDSQEGQAFAQHWNVVSVPVLLLNGKMLKGNVSAGQVDAFIKDAKK